MTTADILMALALAGGMVGGYVSVRVDLARTRTIAEGAAKAADQAHDRIDRMMAGG
jgi:hypothetical protein